MIDQKDITAFYQSRIEPRFRALEPKRRRIAWLRIFIIAFSVLVLGGFIAVCYYTPPYIEFAGAAGIVYAVAAIALYCLSGENFEKQLKSFLVTEVSNFLGIQEGERASKTPLSLQSFQRYGILPSGNQQFLNDHFHGTKDEVEIDIADALIRHKTQTRKKNGGTETTITTLFQGPIFRFSYNRPLKGHVILVKDSGCIVNFFKKSNFPGERVVLENTEFESRFEIYTTDQVEARYVLTPRFMERLLELSSYIKDKSSGIAFSDSFAYLTLDVRANWFEPGSLFSKLADQRRIENLIEQLNLAFEVARILNLSTKSHV